MRLSVLILAVLLSFLAARQALAQTLGVSPSGTAAVTTVGNTSRVYGGYSTAAQLLNSSSPVPGGLQGGGSAVFDNLLSRDFISPSARGGLVDAAERYSISAGGEALEVTLSRGVVADALADAAASVGGAAWAAGAGGLAGAAYAGFQVGAPISKALGNTDLTIGPMRCTATNSGWQCDSGATAPPPQTVTTWYVNLPYSECASYTGLSSRALAIQGEAACRNAHNNISAYRGDDTGYCDGYAYDEVISGTSPNISCQGAHVASQDTQKSGCPAFVDALNPSWSKTDGAVGPDPDGKCPTGRYNGTSNADLAARMKQYGAVAALGSAAAQLAKDILSHGQPLGTTAPGSASGASPQGTPDPGVLTGPSSQAGPSTTTTTTNPDGSPGPSTSTGTTNNYTYNGPSVSVTNTTTTNTGGTTTTTTTTPAAPDVKTCGLPNTPACKIDEGGTPSYMRPDDPFTPQVASDAANTAAVTSTVVAPDFGFIGAPPIADCTPYAFPNSIAVLGGIQIGNLDPCGVVSDVRNVMSYLWALAAAWLCFGWIRQTVNGG